MERRIVQHTFKGRLLAFDGYTVDAEGRVFGPGRHRPHVLHATVNPHGYEMVKLTHPAFGRRWKHHENGRHYDSSTSKPFFVHRLVCWAFHGAPTPERPIVRHLNGRKTDNRASNLAWGTSEENALDTHAHARGLPGHVPDALPPQEDLF